MALGSCGRPAALRALDEEPLYAQAFTGFILAEAETGKVLAERDADKLFTPASNTKLLTLATVLEWLPRDSLPVLTWRADGDTLRLWALASPLLGADDEPYNEAIRDRIATWPGPVELNMHGYTRLPRLGQGWMWDDYPYPFSRERSGLPVYGNLAAAWRSEADVPGGGARWTWEARPTFLAIEQAGTQRAGTLARDEGTNRFVAGAGTPVGDTVLAPLFGAGSLASQLLEDFAGRTIRYHNRPLPTDWRARVWRGLPRDEVVEAMMLPSDNFLAEQLLLQAGVYRDNLTSPQAIRQRAQDSVLHADSQTLAWADASGISHYNLASPRMLARTVQRVFVTDGQVRTDRLHLLPQGGRSGTIERWYAGENGQPYVFAKTGTLRHNHALTGLLYTKRGEWLAFSFMHNHFRGSSRDYKRAMQRTLERIRDRY